MSLYVSVTALGRHVPADLHFVRSFAFRRSRFIADTPVKAYIQQDKEMHVIVILMGLESCVIYQIQGQSEPVASLQVEAEKRDLGLVALKTICI